MSADAPEHVGALRVAVGEGRVGDRLWLYATYHRNLACSSCLTESWRCLSASGGCVAPAPVVALRDTVTTSARRHRANGEVRTFLNVTTIKPLYCLGAHVDRLAPLYRRLR